MLYPVSVDLQNHKITEWLKLESTSGVHFYLEQGQLEQVAQNSVQLDFIISKDEDSTNSLGNLCQCLATLIVKIIFF